MKTYNILIILAVIVLILLVFSNYVNMAANNIPVVIQTPSFLTPVFQEVGPTPCPFPFGCGGKGRPGRGGWFPMSIGRGRGRGGGDDRGQALDAALIEGRERRVGVELRRALRRRPRRGAAAEGSQDAVDVEEDERLVCGGWLRFPALWFLLLGHSSLSYERTVLLRSAQQCSDSSALSRVPSAQRQRHR